jgi:hypothetical protein
MVWSRKDAREQKAREASPDLQSIDQANAADFDERLAQEIAAEGLDMDRDWYLREEGGVMDDDRGHGGLRSEETYTRSQSKSAAAEAPVRSAAYHPNILTVLTMPQPAWT